MIAEEKIYFFQLMLNKHIHQAEMIFISVNTPTKTYGEGKGYGSRFKIC